MSFAALPAGGRRRCWRHVNFQRRDYARGQFGWGSRTEYNPVPVRETEPARRFGPHWIRIASAARKAGRLRSEEGRGEKGEGGKRGEGVGRAGCYSLRRRLIGRRSAQRRSWSRGPWNIEPAAWSPKSVLVANRDGGSDRQG